MKLFTIQKEEGIRRIKIFVLFKFSKMFFFPKNSFFSNQAINALCMFTIQSGNQLGHFRLALMAGVLQLARPIATVDDDGGRHGQHKENAITEFHLDISAQNPFNRKWPAMHMCVCSA